MMFKQCKQKPPLIFIIALLISAALSIGTSHAYYQSIPFGTGIQLMDMTYSYDPATQTLVKSYTLKNISGNLLPLPSPRLVNLFLWSNNICSTSYVTMEFIGGSYSNLDQAATVSGNGTIDWNHDATPGLNSTEVFSSLPVQYTQNNVSYPYVNIPGGTWPNNTSRTVNVTFTGVQNCNWIQNMVYVIYDAGGGPSPTVIALSQFEALPGDGTVTLMWTTQSEKETAGFNIYRGKVGFGRSGRVKSDSELDAVEMEKINTNLISANGSATSGAEYTYTDDDVKNGFTYVYKLEDVDMNGVATEHGPVTATPGWIYSLFHHHNK